MPAWILKLLINLAISWGLPEVLKLVKRWWPGAPQDLLDTIIRIITEAIGGIKAVRMDETLGSREKKIQVRAIKRKAARECSGAACVSVPKG